jgi:hypothetical protein
MTASFVNTLLLKSSLFPWIQIYTPGKLWSVMYVSTDQ